MSQETKAETVASKHLRIAREFVGSLNLSAGDSAAVWLYCSVLNDALRTLSPILMEIAAGDDVTMSAAEIEKNAFAIILKSFVTTDELQQQNAEESASVLTEEKR